MSFLGTKLCLGTSIIALRTFLSNTPRRRICEETIFFLASRYFGVSSSSSAIINTGKTARIRKVRNVFFMVVYLKQWNRQIELDLYRPSVYLIMFINITYFFFKFGKIRRKINFPEFNSIKFQII